MSDDPRPDPDALLAAMQTETAGRGRLKIFLGMCPGVGKTYAMLLAGQQRQEEGIDTVIGFVETHGRIETQALTAGLARVPRRAVQHRGVTLEEMDLDAILARNPDLVLVDELAHSNIAGGRHPKRYQDVLEILEAGIDVYTTLNIQHVESQRDVVTQITGAPVHEAVPDSLLDTADEIELIDISPAQLRKRLDENKVYLGERAGAASENFFREGNLKALREIALRLTAERADREVREFRKSRRIAGPWKVRERLLVAVGPSPHSRRLIRWTRRMASATHGSWIAVSVDFGEPLDDASRARLEKNLALARSLGAEVSITSGTGIVETLLRVARELDVSQIVIGKPLSPRLWDMLRGGSVVDQLIRKSGDIDVYVVRAEKSDEPWRPSFRAWTAANLWKEFGIALLIVLSVTVLGLFLKPTVGYMAIGLLYLLAVVLSSTILSRWPLLFTAALTALAWNALFIVPYYTFYISSIHDAILFGLYFIVALVIGQLNTRLRHREAAERRREVQAALLYEFSRDLAQAETHDAALEAAAARIGVIFRARTSIFLGTDGKLNAEPTVGAAIGEREMAVATYAFIHKEAAGKFTDTLPESAALFIPLRGSHETVGVLSVVFPNDGAPGLQERQLLETFASQLAGLIERDTLKRQTERVRFEEASRGLQRTLLDSVSHEFKTPLAIMASALDGLRKRNADPLLDELSTAVQRLTRIVANLLDITRIETGAVRPRLEWCDLREVIDEAVARTGVSRHRIVTSIPPSAELVLVDSTLLEEILANLVRNAGQNSAEDTEISVGADVAPGVLDLSVIDAGSGVTDPSRIFEKFVRGGHSKAGGLGMGLSVARGFAEALGGTIWHEPRDDGRAGSVFRVKLPLATRSASVIESSP